ncbi:uncharacterized protein LOC111038997 [Myzus persicae]|uniref:uncharacterized protein LOC111038997 n=1 Tax=Myzus persicae TaxID=13164 RepID=UPI000B9319DA|nr:uncharacterized protein LOC111038997 [Myzus persicae]XP_022177966.1 uncharacterized protein LOC111038997 [Myzus persicae]
MNGNQSKMGKKYNCLGSIPKKLLKSDAPPTQELLIDQDKIKSNLISASAISHRSRMEHKAIERAHDQNITTIEESQTHPSTATHTSNPETPEAILEECVTLLRDYEALTYKNEKMAQELVHYRNANESLRLELQALNHNILKHDLLAKESSKRAKAETRKLKLMLRRGREFKMGHFFPSES